MADFFWVDAELFVANGHYFQLDVNFFYDFLCLLRADFSMAAESFSDMAATFSSSSPMFFDLATSEYGQKVRIPQYNNIEEKSLC